MFLIPTKKNYCSKKSLVSDGSSSLVLSRKDVCVYFHFAVSYYLVMGLILSVVMAIFRVPVLVFHELFSIGRLPLLFLVFQTILIPISMFYLFLHSRILKIPQGDSTTIAWISGVLLVSTLLSMWMLFEGNYVNAFHGPCALQKAYPTLYLAVTVGLPVIPFLLLCFWIFITSFI